MWTFPLFPFTLLSTHKTPLSKCEFIKYSLNCFYKKKSFFVLHCFFTIETNMLNCKRCLALAVYITKKYILFSNKIKYSGISGNTLKRNNSTINKLKVTEENNKFEK